MRRFNSIAPLLALGAGGVGFWLRYRELTAMYDGVTAESSMLTLFSIGVTAVVFVFTIIMGLRYTTEKDYDRAFGHMSVLNFILQLMLGLATVGAGVGYGWLLSFVGYMPLISWVFGLFAALSGVAICVLAVSGYRGAKCGGWSQLFCVIPALFMCLWLVMVYRGHASNPNIWEFGFDCLALAAGAFAFYFWAGYVYGRKKTVFTLFSYLMACYLLPVMGAGQETMPQLVLVLLLSGVVVVQSSAFIGNMKLKREN